MKCALLLERDPAARRDITALLRSMNYIVANVDSPAMAINAAHALRYDLMLTDTTFNLNDRRSFLGEMARLAPGVPIVLLNEADRPLVAAHRHCPVLDKPVTLRALRRIVDSGNGDRTSSTRTPSKDRERRRHAPRRASAR
jgi:CheY-like chemotaxis protein